MQTYYNYVYVSYFEVTIISSYFLVLTCYFRFPPLGSLHHYHTISRLSSGLVQSSIDFLLFILLFCCLFEALEVVSNISTPISCSAEQSAKTVYVSAVYYIKCLSELCIYYKLG